MGTASSHRRLAILRSMILVRAFEDRLTEMSRQGDCLPGMQILSTGQEAAVAAVRVLREEDVMVTNHRSHAHLLAREGSDVTVAAYGGAFRTALEAAELLAEEGVSLEVLDLRTLVPLDRGAVLASVTRTGRFVMVHDATRFCGYGAEVAAMVAEEAFSELKAPVRRVAAPDAPVPFAPAQERFYKPGAADVVAAVRSLM